MYRLTSLFVAASALLGAPVLNQNQDAPAHDEWANLVSRIDTPPPPPQCGAPLPQSDRSKAIIEVRRRILADELSDAQWDDLIVPRRLFMWREHWLKGEPLQIQLVNPEWLGQTFEIRATPRLVDGKTLRTGRTWAGPCGLSNAQLASQEQPFDGIESCGAIGVLSDDDTRVEFDIEIRTGAKKDSHPLRAHSWKYWEDSRIVRRASLSLDVRQVDDASEVCRATDVEAARCAVDRVIQPTVYHHNWADGSMHAYLLVDLDRRADQCGDVGFGLTVELLNEDQVVEAIELPGWRFWECSPGGFSAGGEHMFESLLNRHNEFKDPTELGRWSLRIRGVDQLAWSAWSHAEYWDGVLTLPLADVYKDLHTKHLGFTSVRIGGGANDD